MRRGIQTRDTAANSPPWSRRGGRAIKLNGPVPLTGAAGVVCSTSRSHLIDSREALLLNSVRYASIYKEASRHLQTTPAAPAEEASRHLLNGRSHPSLTKEGSSPAPAESSVYKGLFKGGKGW